MVRAATWLISFAAHGLLVAFSLTGVLSRETTALEAGTGDDTFKIEQGIGIEGFMQQGDAIETVEATEAPMQMSEARPQIDEVKPVEQVEKVPEAAELPKETEIIGSKEGPEQEAAPVQEEKPKPVEQPRAQQMASLEQEAQPTVEEQRSAGTKQDGGDAGLKRAYLGRLHSQLLKSKVNPHSRATGTVLVRFAVSPSGALLSREIVTSSGFQILDKAALAAVDKAAPFPAFPDDLKMEQIVEVVPYRFSVR